MRVRACDAHGRGVQPLKRMRKLRKADLSNHKAKRSNRGRLERTRMRDVHQLEESIRETQLHADGADGSC